VPFSDRSNHSNNLFLALESIGCDKKKQAALEGME